jgi:hypothetical protein
VTDSEEISSDYVPIQRDKVVQLVVLLLGDVFKVVFVVEEWQVEPLVG